jgi:hypothetical protein
VDRRDQELLDRPMRHFQPQSRRDGLIIVALAVAVLAGMTAVGIFSLGSHSPARLQPDDGKTALAFFLNGGQKPAR